MNKLFGCLVQVIELAARTWSNQIWCGFNQKCVIVLKPNNWVLGEVTKWGHKFIPVFPLFQILLQARNPGASRWTQTRLQVWTQCKRMEGVREVTVLKSSSFYCWWFSMHLIFFTNDVFVVSQEPFIWMFFLFPLNSPCCCDTVPRCFVKIVFIIAVWQSGRKKNVVFLLKIQMKNL